MSKIKLEITKRQLEAIISLTDTISAMVGTGSNFDNNKKEVALIDKMLKNNGYKRIFN